MPAGVRQHFLVADAVVAQESPAHDTGEVDPRRSSAREWWIGGACIAIAVVIGLALMIDRSAHDWVEVVLVEAPNEAATHVDVTIGLCNPSGPAPTPRVVETRSEVRISVDVRASRGNVASCAVSVPIVLASPLDKRQVIDGHSHAPVEVALSDLGATPASAP